MEDDDDEALAKALELSCLELSRLEPDQEKHSATSSQCRSSSAVKADSKKVIYVTYSRCQICRSQDQELKRSDTGNQLSAGISVICSSMLVFRPFGGLY